MTSRSTIAIFYGDEMSFWIAGHHSLCLVHAGRGLLIRNRIQLPQACACPGVASILRLLEWGRPVGNCTHDTGFSPLCTKRIFESIYIYRNLRTQQMSVLVLLCTFYTCFGPYWWPSSGGFAAQKIRRQLLYVNGSIASVC
jgi:hypothetical protein